MDEYISREALLAELAADYGKWISYNDTDESYHNGVRDNFADTINLVSKMPAADVQPVKHGRWIDFPECLAYEGALDEEYFVCSECHHVWNTVDNCAETFRYCPNCGSKNEDGDGDD